MIVSLLTFVLTAAAAVIIVVRMPADAFSATRGITLPRPSGPLGLLARIGRNLLGGILIIMGFVLAIPGVPGQGLLTILAGVLLIDFPGRHRLLRGILNRPKTRKLVDGLRSRFGQPPLKWEQS